MWQFGDDAKTIVNIKKLGGDKVNLLDVFYDLKYPN